MLSNEKGFSLLILLILILILAVGGFIGWNIWKQENVNSMLVTNNLPEVDKKTAEVSANAVVSAKFDIKANLDSTSHVNVEKDNKITVTIYVSAKEAINVVSMKINYPNNVLKFKQFVPLEEETVSLWMEKKELNPGVLKLTGAIPDPGLKSESDVAIARIEFEMLAAMTEGNSVTPMEVELLTNENNTALLPLLIKSTSYKDEVLGTETGGTISLSPSTISIAPGCNFTVKVSYNANNSHARGVDAVLISESTNIKPVSYVNDSAFAGKNLIITQITNGVARTSLLEPIDRSPLPNTGTIASVTYKVESSASEGIINLDPKFNSADPKNTTDSNIVGADITDMLTKVSGTKIVISKTAKCEQNSTSAAEAVSTQYKPTPTTATSSATPITDTEGDLSADGKITLSDMSVLMKKFNKKRVSAAERLDGDLNKDGKVNVLDYSIMTRFLIKKNVITE